MITADNLYAYKAVVLDAYDGDTVTVLIDLGLHVKVQAKVRLLGINAPELRGAQRDKGLLSKARIEELILNKTVYIKTYKDRKEKYGRWLGEIYTTDSDKSVNQILIDEGFAWPYHD